MIGKIFTYLIAYVVAGFLTSILWAFADAVMMAVMIALGFPQYAQVIIWLVLFIVSLFAWYLWAESIKEEMEKELSQLKASQ